MSVSTFTHKVNIRIADCGAIETIRRVNGCLRCWEGGTESCVCCQGTGLHRLEADWEKEFQEAYDDRRAMIYHCPQGHPYTEENTRIDTKGSRVCRTCERIRSRDYQRRKRAA